MTSMMKDTSENRELFRQILVVLRDHFIVSKGQFSPKDETIRLGTRRYGFTMYSIHGLEISVMDQRYDGTNARFKARQDEVDCMMDIKSIASYFVEVSAAGFRLGCIVTLENKYENGRIFVSLAVFNAEIEGEPEKAYRYFTLAKLTK